jgi:hypothetical protein
VIWNFRLIGVLVALSLCAGSVWYAYNKGKQSGMSQVQTLWDAERAVQLAAQAEAEMKARQTEQGLQAMVNRVRQEKQREAIKLANDYAAVIDSLRDRAETRAGDGGVPEGAAAGVGCTGQGLAKRDAEFLAGYAADAARTQSALNACITAYDQVREQINGP